MNGGPRSFIQRPTLFRTRSVFNKVDRKIQTQYRSFLFDDGTSKIKDVFLLNSHSVNKQKARDVSLTHERTLFVGDDNYNILIWISVLIDQNT